MTKTQFLKQYPGRLSLSDFVSAALKEKKLDWDGAYSEQCVDLFRFYCHCVLGIQQPAGVIGAKDFFSNYENDPMLRDNFEKIKNTPDFIPRPGDVCIFGANAANVYGHIAIALDGSSLVLINTLDQNVTPHTITKETHVYKTFWGVLRPRGL